MPSPLISVVIPTFNASKFLREALDSLVAQTFTDWEAICVNDGSTDDSLAIMQEYAAKDGRFRILDGPNGGYGKAMNRGMDAAKGKYMAIFEPDDVLPKCAYRSLYDAAEKYGVDMARGRVLTFYGNEGKKVYEANAETYPFNQVFCPKEIPGYFRTKIQTWSVLYRVDFLQSIRFRYHESPGASYQDTGLFFLSLIHAEKVVCIPNFVYEYRVDNPSSSVNTCSGKIYAVMDEYKYIYHQLSAQHTCGEMVLKLFYESYFNSNKWIYSRISQQQQKEFLARFREELRAMRSYGYLTFSEEQVHAIADFVSGAEETPFLLNKKPEKKKKNSYFRKREWGNEAFYYTFLGVPFIFGKKVISGLRMKILGVIPVEICSSVLEDLVPEDGIRYQWGRLTTYKIMGVTVKERKVFF